MPAGPTIALSQPPRPVPKRGFAARYFGYDVFISFALGPPPRGSHSYASDLARRLRELDFTVFFSEDEAPVGNELDETLKQALNRSQTLVVIANRGTLADPRWIRTEVEEFRLRHPQRPIVPINIGGALQDPDLTAGAEAWLRFRNRIWVDESEQAGTSGIASDEVVARLASAPRASRANSRWRIAVGSVIVTLVVLLVGAVGAAIYATQQRDEARRQEAEVRRTLAAADFNRGNSLLESGAAADALAHLARAIRTERTNHDAANLLCSVLLTRNFPVLVANSLRHEGEIAAASFSPDGRRILTASGRSAFIWSVANGDWVAKALTHDFTVHGAEFSLDGKLALTFGRHAVIWNAETSSVVAVARVSNKPVDAGEEAEEARATMSPDSTKIAFSADGGVGVYDRRTGARIGKPLEGGITDMSFSPDGRTILLVPRDGSAMIWNTADGRRRLLAQRSGSPRVAERGNASRPSKDRDVSSARFDPTGSRVISTAGNAAQVWSTGTVRRLGMPLQHGYVVQDGRFSPDGARVITASFDGTARLWDAATSQPLGAVMKHASANAGEFSADGLRALTVPFEETTVLLWNALTGTAVSEPLAHEAAVTAGTFSPHGATVLTTSDDRQVRLWDVRPRSALHLVLTHTAETTAAAISSDGSVVVSGAADNTARLWDASTGQPIGAPMVHLRADATGRSQSGRVAAHSDFINFALFSPDASAVFTSSTDESVRFWSAKSGAPLAEPLVIPGFAIDAFFSGDGRVLLYATKDAAWQLSSTTGQAVGEPIKVPGHEIEKVAMSPDGRRVLTATESLVFAWDTSSGRQLFELEHKHGSIAWIELSPSGRFLVTAGTDGVVRFWDAEDGHDLGRSLKHNNTVLSARFNRDGSRLVTGSWDKTARIWDSSTGEPIGSPMWHANYVGSVEFSADGTRVVTVSGGGGDNEGRVWSATTGRPVSEPIRAGNAETIRFAGGGDRLLLVPEGGTVVALYDLPAISARDVGADLELLADLAEAVGGRKLVPAGAGERLVMMSANERAAVLDRREPGGVREPGAPTGLRNFLAWYLSDPAVRTISPLTALTIPQWVNRQIRSDALEAVREAMLRDWNNPALNARLGTLLARLAIKLPRQDEGKRARQEADFFTMRAIHLDPANAAAVQARTEVVKRLGLASR